ncbi:MAG TPA: hypothetical protein VEY68_15480 [Anoxybacillus sp.]|nr:hypothetical protein [Anoxybacillus sp.]
MRVSDVKVYNKNDIIGKIKIFTHFIMLSIAVYFALRAIRFGSNHTQASMEFSILLGKARGLWGGYDLLVVWYF